MEVKMILSQLASEDNDGGSVSTTHKLSCIFLQLQLYVLLFFFKLHSTTDTHSIRTLIPTITRTLNPTPMSIFEDWTSKS